MGFLMYTYHADDQSAYLALFSDRPEGFTDQGADANMKLRGFVGEECIPLYQNTEPFVNWLEKDGPIMDKIVKAPAAAQNDMNLMNDVMLQITNLGHNGETKTELEFFSVGGYAIPEPASDNKFHSVSHDEINLAMSQAVENERTEAIPESHCEMLLGQNGSSPTNLGMKNG